MGNIKKKRTRKSQPWYDTECHILKKKLTYISNQKHKGPFDKQIRLSYNFLNKEYKGLLRRKKRNHQDIKMAELTHTNNPNQFWSTLRDMSTKQTKPRDNSIPVDKLYSHFQHLHSKPDPNSDEQRNTLKDIEKLETQVLPIDDLDKPITESEVRKAVKLLKLKKAAGLDRVRNEMLKCGINQLASSLVKLFNFIVTKGSLPDIWSTGIISPILKSGNKSDPSNYRGIFVTSCLSKLFSSVLNLRLSNFLQDQKILNPSQIGFLRGYRTTDHIFSMRTLIDKYVINATKGKLFCCFVDFQKAFDSIWHEGLFLKLLNNKIGGSFYRLISGNEEHDCISILEITLLLYFYLFLLISFFVQYHLCIWERK